MGGEHLSLEILASWLSGELPHDEVVRRVVPHLISSCAVCQQRYEEVLRLQREFEHWDESIAVREGLRAPEQLARLTAASFEERLRLIEVDAEYQNWGLCQLLLKASLASARDDPGDAIEHAELGVRIAELLPPESYDPHWIRDLRAKAWACLANARRVLGEHRSADEAFRRAESHLAESLTGNNQIRAQLLDLKASLRRDQRRFPEALELIDEAMDLYEKSGELSNRTRSAVKKATILEEQGELQESVELLCEVMSQLDAEKEPRLFLCARFNLLSTFIVAGRLAEAESLLPEVRRLVDAEHNPLDLVRLAWAEGRIALGLGRLGAAEAAFREVQREFFARGMGYDAALVSLDLAILYAQEGCTAEIKQLASEILPVFESREVHREAMAALLMFQQAAEEETLTLELARQLADFLQRERRRRG